MNNKIRMIKIYHTMISFIIFCFMLVYGITKIDLSLEKFPLSKLGTYNDTNAPWMISLSIISIVIIINSVSHIIELNLRYKKITTILFILSSISLFGVAFVNMRDNNEMHNLLAASFFIFYSMSIFITGLQLIKRDFRMAMMSIIISILMLFSFSWLLNDAQAIPEIIFILLSYLWNFILLYTNEFKNLLKQIGF